MCDDSSPRARPSFRRGRALPTRRGAPLLLLVLVLLLGACDTAQAPDPADPNDPAPEEPATGDPATPDLARVEIALGRIATTDPSGAPASFDRPLGVATDGSSDLLYVMEQGGRVWVVEPDGTVRPEPFLDLSSEVLDDEEAGLLGLAFHPGYPEVAQVFVHYTPGTSEADLRSVIARMNVADDGTVLEAERDVLFAIDQPSTRHNGGQLAFGPDGMLYAALGEGDPNASPSLARDPGTPYGAILRIDPEAEGVGDAPSDNPFVGVAVGHDLVWHYGFRNPWRFSFDAATGDLWIADVGEASYEEVNVVRGNERAGLDFGWDLMEGRHCIVEETCAGEEIERPVLVYSHPEDGGRSVTGGYVYRGDALPDLVGAYVFGDFVTGTIWASAPGSVDEDETVAMHELLSADETDIMIVSFGLDANNELLVVDRASGNLYRIVPAANE